MQGILKGFDQATNIILDESHERVFSTKVWLIFLAVSFKISLVVEKVLFYLILILSQLFSFMLHMILYCTHYVQLCIIIWKPFIWHFEQYCIVTHITPSRKIRQGLASNKMLACLDWFSSPAFHVQEWYWSLMSLKSLITVNLRWSMALL